MVSIEIYEHSSIIRDLANATKYFFKQFLKDFFKINAGPGEAPLNLKNTIVSLIILYWNIGVIMLLLMLVRLTHIYTFDPLYSTYTGTPFWDYSTLRQKA